VAAAVDPLDLVAPANCGPADVQMTVPLDRPGLWHAAAYAL